MKDETIISYITRLNNNDFDGIIITPITANVHWGYVWKSVNETDEHIPLQGDEMFFIKAEDGKFAAAVNRLHEDDMHWLVDDGYRGKGILVRPLIDVILPFIFTFHRKIDSQRGSLRINGQFAMQSSHLAEKVGLTKCAETEAEHIYEIKREAVKTFHPSKRSRLTKAEFDKLNREIVLHVRGLRMTLDQIRVKHVSPFHHPISDLADTALLNLNSARIELADALRYDTQPF